MKKMYKMLFFTTLISSTLLTVSSYSWLGMWIGLEMNLLSMIPLMLNSNNILTTEASIKYFITQTMASVLIMMSLIMMSINNQFNSTLLDQTTLVLIMNSSLLTKMGTAPFHFWFPEVMEGLSWLNCLMVLTWQKIAPMILFMYNMYSTMYTTIIIMISMLISGFMMINQISLRKILTYSSINHNGWMLSSMMFMETTWLLYFIIYSITTISMVLVFNSQNLSTMKQITQTMNMSTMNKIFFLMNFMNLSGIPPLMGFFPKWITLQILVFNNMYMLPTLMIITTLLTIFIYMKLLMPTLMMKINELVWINKMNKITMKISTINSLSIMSLVIWIMLYM